MEIGTCNLKFEDPCRCLAPVKHVRAVFVSMQDSRITMQGNGSFFDFIPQAYKFHCHCLSMSKLAGKSAASNITPVFQYFVTRIGSEC